MVVRHGVEVMLAGVLRVLVNAGVLVDGKLREGPENINDRVTSR